MEQAIKEKIKKLKTELSLCKKELMEICSHERLIKGNDVMHNIYVERDEFVFICANCDKVFITDDPNFKYKGE